MAGHPRRDDTAHLTLILVGIQWLFGKKHKKLRVPPQNTGRDARSRDTGTRPPCPGRRRQPKPGAAAATFVRPRRYLPGRMRRRLRPLKETRFPPGGWRRQAGFSSAEVPAIDGVGVCCARGEACTRPPAPGFEGRPSAWLAGLPRRFVDVLMSALRRRSWAVTGRGLPPPARQCSSRAAPFRLRRGGGTGISPEPLQVAWPSLDDVQEVRRGREKVHNSAAPANAGLPGETSGAGPVGPVGRRGDGARKRGRIGAARGRITSLCCQTQPRRLAAGSCHGGLGQLDGNVRGR